MDVDRTKFWSLCLSMFPLVALACGGGGNDGTETGGSDLTTTAPTDGGASPTDAVTVKATAVRIQNDQCNADVQVPTVSIPTNKAAETAINAVLAPLASPCQRSPGVSATFEVTANANGLLSIRVTGSDDSQGLGREKATLESFDFDVKNGGKRLSLTDVVTADGAAKQLQRCITTAAPAIAANTGSSADEGSFATTDCKSAIAAQRVGPTWVARPDGLELGVSTDPAAGRWVLSVVPWKDLLPTGLTAGTVVVDFAKAQK